MTNKQYALSLAAIGWHVFPCGMDKKPLCKWKETATTDPATIEAMTWNGLVGIYCSKSGFFAIDLDTKNGANGLETWTRWQDHYGFAEGPVQQTPSGGAHALFKLPDHLVIPNKAGLFPGVDLRSEGYICSGQGYKWLNPPETAIPDAPTWFLDFIDPELEGDQQPENSPREEFISTVKAAAEKLGGVVRQLPQADYWLEKYIPQASIGRRNETGFTLACQVRDAGIPRSECEALPYPERCPQGEDQYTRPEWLLTVKSAYERTPREPAKKKTIQASGDKLTTTGPQEPEAPPFEPEPPQEAPKKEMTLRPRFILRDAAFALQPQPPVNYVVDNLIVRPSVDVVFGEPGSKKTRATLSLAVCVANGKDWLGFKTTKTPVLILDEDNGEIRLQRWLGEAIRGELCDGSSPITFTSMASFKLDDTTDPLLIQTIIEQTGAGLIIIDNLATVIDGDENDKKDMQPALNALRRISEATNSAILIIHHSNKMGGYRGSSAIKGSIDLLIQAQSEDGNRHIDFETQKNRDGDKSKWAADATWTEDSFYLTAAEKQERPRVLSKSQEYVIRYLTEHGPSSIIDIAAAADVCTPGSAETAIFNLAHLKLIYRTNPEAKGRGAEAIYDLVKKATQE